MKGLVCSRNRPPQEDDCASVTFQAAVALMSRVRHAEPLELPPLTRCYYEA